MQLTLGKILRQPLLASEALDHPSALAPPRDRHLLAASRLRSLRAEPRGRVRRGGPGRGARVPLAALPDLSTALARPGEPGGVSGGPAALPACFQCARGSSEPGDGWYPRRKIARSSRCALCLWPGRGGAVRGEL